MKLEYVLFDLDDTLYPRDRLMPSIDALLITFLRETLQIDEADALRKQDHYNNTYGTVLRGLLQEETVDTEAYLEFIHDIPVNKLLEPDPSLAKLLADIPLRKCIFTNSYHKHAKSVLATLGINDQFEQIFDIVSVDFVSKPAPHPYKAVVNMLSTTAQACIFVDDKAKNLKEPKKLGMRTILVDAEPDEWVDATISHIHEIGDVIQKFIDSATD